MSQTVLTVGTEYLDRKIVGTGTEDNPWIIGSVADDTDENMFQNFLDAVYTNSAYVKLARDIDVAKSKTYREGLGSCITIYAAKVYADESKAAIKNLITTEKLFNFPSTTLIITNIQFLNSIVNNAASSAIIAPLFSGSNISHCDFSLLIRGIGSSISNLINDAGNISHCSFDIKVINGNLWNASFPGLENCQINIDATVGASSTSSPTFKNCSKCGITGNLKLPSGTSYILGSCSYCYFAGAITTDTSNAVINSPNNTNTYFCIDAGENVSLSSNVTTITSDQLKSKEYLYEIGFLP